MDLLLWFGPTTQLMWALHDTKYGITGQRQELSSTPVSKLREAFKELRSIIVDHPKVLRHFKTIVDPTLKPLLEEIKVHYVTPQTLQKYVNTIVE